MIVYDHKKVTFLLHEMEEVLISIKLTKNSFMQKLAINKREING